MARTKASERPREAKDMSNPVLVRAWPNGSLAWRESRLRGRNPVRSCWVSKAHLRALARAEKLRCSGVEMPCYESERPGVSLAGRPEYNRAITARCFPAAQRFFRWPWRCPAVTRVDRVGAVAGAQLGVGRLALETLEFGAETLHQQVHAGIASQPPDTGSDG